MTLLVFSLLFTATASAMSLAQYRTTIRNQHDWTNRAQENRCRDTRTLAEFTKTPLRVVNPFWRRFHIAYAKARHVVAQRRSSQCAPWPTWWLSGALCIHSHEGAWNDPNPPYWGGMQMDYSFMSTYGPEFLRAYGTADHWTPFQQLLASWRAYRSGRGWTPWPNTARICGLIG